MSIVADEIIGTHYRYPDYFEVGREKVREFARATMDDHPMHFDTDLAAEAGHPGVVAPLTFIAVAGRRVQLDLFKNFDVGFDLSRVIHRDQKMKFHRPIVAGDRLYFDAYLDSVVESHGTVIAELRSEITDADGQPVMTTIVTMIGETASNAERDAQIAAIASRMTGA